MSLPLRVAGNGWAPQILGSAPLGPSQNNIPSSVMTRRNTYVCTERPGADRHSLLHNGKENR